MKRPAYTHAQTLLAASFATASDFEDYTVPYNPLPTARFIAGAPDFELVSVKPAPAGGEEGRLLWTVRCHGRAVQFASSVVPDSEADPER